MSNTQFEKYFPWGSSHNFSSKKRHLAPLLLDLEAQGRIGSRICDFGSGGAPLSDFLTSALHKRVLIDIMAEQSKTDEAMFLKFDLEKFLEPETFAVRKLIAKVCKFLNISDVEARQDPKQIDCMIFSDVLNYIKNHREILRYLLEYLRDDGCAIIVHGHEIGFTSLFADDSPESSDALLQTVDELGFEVFEQKRALRPNGISERLTIFAKRKILPASHWGEPPNSQLS